MRLVPLGDKVVLKHIVAESTTKSGIVLASNNQDEPLQAEVVAVGPGGMVDGNEVTMLVSVGDQVFHSRYSGTEVKLNGEKYLIVKQSDILAIIK